MLYATMNMPPARDNTPRKINPERARLDELEKLAFHKIACCYGPGKNHAHFDEALHGERLRMRETPEFDANVKAWLVTLANAGVVAGVS